MTAYELKNIAILNVKGVDFKCILWSISRDEAVNNLNNSVLKVSHKWILVQIKHLLKKLKEEEHILERFILVLLESGTKSHGKKLFG